jgi:hypothetical protein
MRASDDVGVRKPCDLAAGKLNEAEPTVAEYVLGKRKPS